MFCTDSAFLIYFHLSHTCRQVIGLGPTLVIITLMYWWKQSFPKRNKCTLFLLLSFFKIVAMELPTHQNFSMNCKNIMFFYVITILSVNKKVNRSGIVLSVSFSRGRGEGCTVIQTSDIIKNSNHRTEIFSILVFISTFIRTLQFKCNWSSKKSTTKKSPKKMKNTESEN